MIGPFDYSMCDQTVTVYHNAGERISRKVISGCYYHWQEMEKEDEMGVRRETTCVLILPGNEHTVMIGDRVLPGDGPILTTDDYRSFLPGSAYGLAEINYVTPCYWEGEICHTECGRK